jgi:uncharacterized membrane protein YhaH (DUF805 family)
LSDDSFGVRFALGTLATWRVTHLVAEEDGPADVVVRLRAQVGEGWLGDLLDCFYCLTVWVAAPIALVTVKRLRDTSMTWLALSGAACLLEQATRERLPTIEQRGNDHELLWQQAEVREG